MDDTRKLKTALTKLTPFWIFTFVYKVAASLHYTLMPVLGVRVLPVWIVGLLIGGEALAQLLLDVPAGFALDHFGYVRLLKLGGLLFMVAAIVLLFGITPFTFVCTLIFSTFGWLFFGPGVDAYVLTSATKRFAGRFIAMRDIAESAGVVCAMIILPLVVIRAPRTIGIALLVIFALALSIALFIAPDRHSLSTEKKISKQGLYIRRHFLTRLRTAFTRLNPVSTILCLQGFSSSVFYGIIWFVIPLMIARNLASGNLSWGLAIFDFSVLIIGFLAGTLTDHWKKRWLIFWGLLLFSVCAAVLGFNFGILFLVIGFLATTGDELASISLWAWMDHLDKNHGEDSLVTGAINLAQDLGWTVGPIIAGFLFIPFGPSWTIAAGAIFIFATWVAASVSLHRAVRPTGPFDADEYYPKTKRHKR